MNRFSNLPVKRGIAALGIAAVLGGAAVGIAGAQQTPTPTRPPGALATPGAPGQRSQQEDTFLAAVAAKLGVAAEKLKQAIADTRNDLGLPAGSGGFGFGPGPGHRGPGGPVVFDTTAKAIGISADQLRQELPGKSLADVATVSSTWSRTSKANVLPAPIARCRCGRALVGWFKQATSAAW